MLFRIVGFLMGGVVVVFGGIMVIKGLQLDSYNPKLAGAGALMIIGGLAIIVLFEISNSFSKDMKNLSKISEKGRNSMPRF